MAGRWMQRLLGVLAAPDASAGTPAPRPRGSARRWRRLAAWFGAPDPLVTEPGLGHVIGLTLERRGNTLLAHARGATPGALYHWWANGRYAGRGLSATRAFSAPAGAVLVIDCRAVRRRHLRAAQLERPQPHGRLELEWLRSDVAELHEYLVQVRVSGGGAWSTVRRVRHVPGRWDYRVRTPQLADDTLYECQVVPVDVHGNSGTALSLGAQRVVRLPDSVPAAVTYDGGTGRFTVDAL